MAQNSKLNHPFRQICWYVFFFLKLGKWKLLPAWPLPCTHPLAHLSSTWSTQTAHRRPTSRLKPTGDVRFDSKVESIMGVNDLWSWLVMRVQTFDVRWFLCTWQRRRGSVLCYVSHGEFPLPCSASDGAEHSWRSQQQVAHLSDSSTSLPEHSSSFTSILFTILSVLFFFILLSFTLLFSPFCPFYIWLLFLYFRFSISLFSACLLFCIFFLSCPYFFFLLDSTVLSLLFCPLFFSFSPFPVLLVISPALSFL